MAELVIMGAGLAGLSAAYHAQKRNLEYKLYEAAGKVGGLSSTTQREGFYFDYSGHLLHLKDPYFQALVKELLGDNINVLTRNAVIFSHGVFTPYPFQANLRGLPPLVVKECLLEFVRAYYGNEDLPTQSYTAFRDWILAKLGSGIGKYFMFPYNEKMWTVPTDTLTCEWLGEYVPKPNLEDVFNGAFDGPSRPFGYNATFWYPKHGGIQSLCDAFAKQISDLYLNQAVTAIDLRERTVRLAAGDRERYKRLISTMPLNKLIEKLGDQLPQEVRVAAQNLRHNSVLIVNLGVKGSGLTDRHWIYLPEKRFTAYRVGVYSNFSESLAPRGTTSFYVEIGYRQEWNIDKKSLVAKAVEDVVEIGLIRDQADILVKDVVDLECAYVIYDKNYAESRRVIMDFLSSHGIASIGRYGSWEYSGMEEAMARGREAVEQIG